MESVESIQEILSGMLYLAHISKSLSVKDLQVSFNTFNLIFLFLILFLFLINLSKTFNNEMHQYNKNVKYYWQQIPNTVIFIKAVVQHCDLGNGWHQYDGKCYKEMNDAKNWNAANDTCKNNGGRLVVMKEQSQIDALEHLQFCADYETGIWIGMTDKVKKSSHYCLSLHLGADINNLFVLLLKQN